MQIKVTTLLKNLVGDKPLLTEGTNDTIMLRATLLNVLINTLQTPGPNGPVDEQLPGETKVQMFILAQRISKHATVDLTVEDITLLKDRVAKAYPPLITGRVWELLDSASVKRDGAKAVAPRRSQKTTKKKHAR